MKTPNFGTEYMRLILILSKYLLNIYNTPEIVFKYQKCLGFDVSPKNEMSLKYIPSFYFMKSIFNSLSSGGILSSLPSCTKLKYLFKDNL